MDARFVLESVLVVLGIILAGIGIYAAVVFIRATRDAREAIVDLHARLVPLIDKADVSLDAVNAEILRLDGIVTDIEEVSGAVSSATEMIRTPVDAIAGIGGRIARSLSRARRS